MDINGLLLEVAAPTAVRFVDDVVKKIAERDDVKEVITNDPESLSMLYVMLEWADRKMGDDEDELEEVAVDEVKKALIDIAERLEIPAVHIPFPG